MWSEAPNNQLLTWHFSRQSPPSPLSANIFPMAPTARNASQAPTNTAAAPGVLSLAHSRWSGDVAILIIYLATATVLVHLITGGQYGFHRDELATLDDARHLAWGYVAYPPVTPFFGRLSLILFGTSLTGFRFFAAAAQAAAVVLTGLMARHMGARRGTQLIAAAASLPFCLGALRNAASAANSFPGRHRNLLAVSERKHRQPAPAHHALVCAKLAAIGCDLPFHAGNHHPRRQLSSVLAGRDRALQLRIIAKQRAPLLRTAVTTLLSDTYLRRLHPPGRNLAAGIKA